MAVPGYVPISKSDLFQFAMVLKSSIALSSAQELHARSAKVDDGPLLVETTTSIVFGCDFEDKVCLSIVTDTDTLGPEYVQGRE